MQRGAVAEREPRVRVGRSHYPQVKRAVRRLVGAEDSPSGDLSDAVHARDAAAHVPCRAVVPRRRACVQRVEHRSNRPMPGRVARFRRRGGDTARLATRGRPSACDGVRVRSGRTRIRPPDARQRRGARSSRFRRVENRRARIVVRRREHRPHDLAVAGAPAQHPAERVEHLRLGRGTRAAEQGARGHQHARRADPALGRAVRVERLLQPARGGRSPPGSRRWRRSGRPPGRATPGRRRPARRRAGPCTRRSHRRRSPPWFRSARGGRGAPASAAMRAPRRPRRSGR